MQISMSQYGGRISISYKIDDKWFEELNKVLTKMVKDSERGSPDPSDPD